MKNKDLIYLALGLGALYLFTKKKDTTEEVTETTTTPDVGNDKNDTTTDTTTDTTSDVVDYVDTNSGVVDSASGGSPILTA